MEKKNTILEVYEAVMDAARKNREDAEDETISTSDRRESLGAQRELYWVAAMLENTEEVNPTKHE